MRFFSSTKKFSFSPLSFSPKYANTYPFLVPLPRLSHLSFLGDQWSSLSPSSLNWKIFNILSSSFEEGEFSVGQHRMMTLEFLSVPSVHFSRDREIAVSLVCDKWRFNVWEEEIEMQSKQEIWGHTGKNEI